MSKKIAIVGTAETWRETPWQERDRDIATLNDAYCLGFPRIDIHYEQHPLDKLYLRKRDGGPIAVSDIPSGHYLRPEGHMDWLKAKSQDGIVYLQDDPPEGFGPGARRYPREDIVERFRDVLFIDPTWPKEYVASGPSWMLMWAITEGYDDIAIYGIHLATQREYVEQRPNFECLIGYAIGKGISITLPPTTPICKSSYVYCYEKRLSQDKDALRYRLGLVERDLRQTPARSSAWWPWSKPHPQRVALEAQHHELQLQLNQLEFQDQLSRPEWRVR